VATEDGAGCAVGAVVAVAGGIVGSGGGAGFVATGVAVGSVVVAVAGALVAVATASGVAVGVALPGRLQAVGPASARTISAKLRIVRGQRCIGNAPSARASVRVARTQYARQGV
jgi:hypothetical protein